MKYIMTKTRCGYPVRIYAVDGGYNGGIHGAVFVDGLGWRAFSWLRNGKSYITDPVHDYDLIEVVEGTLQLKEKMSGKIYHSDEKQIIHEDGWMNYVRDADEGMLEIGYREWDAETKKYVKRGESLIITLDMAEHLAAVITYFTNRPKQDN